MDNCSSSHGSKRFYSYSSNQFIYTHSTNVIFILVLLALLSQSTSFATDSDRTREQQQQQQQKQHTRKITGGREATPGRYPYQVALYKSFGEHGCSGTLIEPDWVLSAAHCAGGYSRVEIGRHNRSDPSEVYESIDIAFEVVHPGYTNEPGKIFHDVVLFKLRSASSYNTIALDDGLLDLTAPGTNTTSIGWGWTNFSLKETSEVLLETENWIMNQTKCTEIYNLTNRVVTEDMICETREEGKGSCKGDSGGPFLIKGQDASSDIQIGITSWGVGCAGPTLPGVKGRVSAEIDFIRSVQECDVPAGIMFDFCCKASCNDGVLSCDSYICLHRNALIWEYWGEIKNGEIVRRIRSFLQWIGLM